MVGCSFGALMQWHGWWGMLALILVLAVGTGLLARRANAEKRRADSVDTLSILKRRLALGEITAKEYETLKQYL